MKELFHLHLSKLGCFKKNRIVSRRVMLVALLSLMTLPIFAETSNSIGVFFVSKTKVVSFAPGNLQYDKKTSKYSFASEQYAMLGVYNVTGGEITREGAGKENKTGSALANKIDLFGWSSTQSNPRNHYGVSIADIDSYYAGDFLDWGNNVIGDYVRNIWRTLTYDEWSYLRTDRPNANNLIAIARIDFAEQPLYNGDAYMNGLILLPDNWKDVKPDDITIKPGFANVAHENNFHPNNFFNIQQWKQLEAAGAVFLPAAGMRGHGDPTISPRPVTGIYNTQYLGHYWTAKPREDGKAGVFEFNSSKALLSAQKRYGGRAVRLAQDTLPVEVTLPIDKVTSSAGQTVKVRIPITLSSLFGMNGNSPTTITGKSSNSAFTVMPLENVGPGKYELIVHYTPTVTTDGIETTTITLSSSTLEGHTSFKMTGRHLARNFVIATKVGNEWVALTADISGDGIQRALPIVVDNNTTPTKATFAFDFCQYQLLGLTDPNRFTENGTAVHLYSTKVEKVLKACIDSDTKKDLGLKEDNSYPRFSEWQLVSQDLVHYTIINSNEYPRWENNRILGYCSDDGAWGMYNILEDLRTYIFSQDIFLLPVETPLADNMEVMEWGTNSMIVRFKDGSALPENLGIYLAGRGTIHDISILNGSDLGRIDSIDLTGNNCTTMAILQLSTANGTILRKPIIVESGTTFDPGTVYYDFLYSDNCHFCDIVVHNGATLLSSEHFVNFANIYIYPGGKLYFEEEADQLGAINKVYLRGGYSWLDQKNYALPEIYLNEHIYFKGSNNIIYDYYIKPYKYYQFALPFTVSLSDVSDEASYYDFPVWVKHYNGALRAADAYATSWEYYNGDAFEAGKGYIIAARPRQVGSVQNRPLSIIRFPLRNNDLDYHIPNDFSVETKAHGINGYKEGTVTANNVGWNFVGNPFLSPWKGDIGHKALKKHNDDEGQWDGSYDWVDDKVKYITVMSAENGSEYYQSVASNTELKPFFPFFMQETADEGSGTINFAADYLKNGPLMLSAKTAPRQVFVQFEIMADGEKDQTGMFIGDHYSDDIDFDDYEKMFGSSTDKAKIWLVHQDKRMAFEAMTETTAVSPIALGYRAPQTGHYTFAINEEVSELEDVLAVYLTDHLAGVVDHDLLDEVYEFESESAIYNDNRFTVRVVLRNEAPGTTTDIEDIIGVHPDSELPHKFIFQNRMYILRNGIIYDATGQQVSTIDK